MFEMYNRVKFFEIVDVYSNSGKDLARVFDSSGADTFRGQMGYSRFTGAGYDIRMHDFLQVMAFSHTGGVDSATLIDSALKDEFHGKAHKCTIFDQVTKGDVYSVTARAFEDVHVEATNGAGEAGDGGFDKAKLWGTVWDDLVAGWSERLTYSRQRPGQPEDLLYSLLGFEWVKIRETAGGNDTATTTPPLEYELIFEAGWN